ncbi:unnamed protein product [Rhodiola kirilowii]
MVRYRFPSPLLITDYIAAGITTAGTGRVDYRASEAESQKERKGLYLPQLHYLLLFLE